jgi:hypothetical protein
MLWSECSSDWRRNLRRMGWARVTFLVTVRTRNPVVLARPRTKWSASRLGGHIFPNCSTVAHPKPLNSGFGPVLTPMRLRVTVTVTFRLRFGQVTELRYGSPPYKGETVRNQPVSISGRIGG